MVNRIVLVVQAFIFAGVMWYTALNEGYAEGILPLILMCSFLVLFTLGGILTILRNQETILKNQQTIIKKLYL